MIFHYRKSSNGVNKLTMKRPGLKIAAIFFMVWESIKLSQPLKLHKEVLNPAKGVMKFLVTIFIVSLFTANLFATQAEFKMIKELEQMEKGPAGERIVRPNVAYKAWDLRDPFQDFKPKINKKAEVSESVEKPPQPPPLTVQGLIWGGRFPQAIINNKVVKEGDTLEGARIISINKEGVTVSFELREYKLSSPAVMAGPSKNP